MNKSKYNVTKTLQLENRSDLNQSWNELLGHAVRALKTSYSPYSGFKVGAAIILENGEIILGSNQENASYPLCMCAERVAVYTANVVAHNVKILAIAVTAIAKIDKGEQTLSPCGACRQVLIEREILQGSILPILCGYPDGPFTIYPSIKTLLPNAFGPDSLI